MAVQSCWPSLKIAATAALFLAAVAASQILSPVVSRVSPSIGGSAGGTLLSIEGHSLGDGYDWIPVVSIASIPCDVLPFLSTESRIVCRTRSWHSWSDSGYKPVNVYVGNMSAACAGSCRYRWYHGYTPSLRTVNTPYATAESEISLYMRPLTTNPSIVSVHVGDRMCPWSGGEIPEGDLLPGSGSWMTYTCSGDSERAGGRYNVSIRVEDRSGNAWPDTRSYQLGPGAIPFHISSQPVISDVHPREISLLGSTVVSIRGQGFGRDTENVQVRAGGLPCRVLKTSKEEIHCVTTPSQRTTREIAFERGGNGTHASGQYLLGPAGVRQERYNDIPGSAVGSWGTSDRVASDMASSVAFRPNFDSPSNIGN